MPFAKPQRSPAQSQSQSQSPIPPAGSSPALDSIAVVPLSNDAYLSPPTAATGGGAALRGPLLVKRILASGSPSASYSTLTMSPTSSSSSMLSLSGLDRHSPFMSPQSSGSSISRSLSSGLQLTTANISIPSGLSLITAYNASSDKTQLEEMEREAATAKAASLASSSAPSPYSSTAPSPSPGANAALSGSELDRLLQPAVAIPTRRTPSPQDTRTALPAEAPSLVANPTLVDMPLASTQDSHSKHLSRKQRLFAMSSSEDEDGAQDSPRFSTMSSPPKQFGSMFRPPTVDRAQSASETDKLKSDRRYDPSRRSISALSGVTVIGKGGTPVTSSPVMQSTQLAGSSRPLMSYCSNTVHPAPRSQLSLDEDDDGALQRFHDSIEAEASMRPVALRSVSDLTPFTRDTTNNGRPSLDLSSALHLLQKYPSAPKSGRPSSPPLPVPSEISAEEPMHSSTSMLRRDSQQNTYLASTHSHPDFFEQAGTLRCVQADESVSPTSHEPPRLPGSAHKDAGHWTAHPRSRRHSRSGAAEGLSGFALSPLTSPLTAVAPRTMNDSIYATNGSMRLRSDQATGNGINLHGTSATSPTRLSRSASPRNISPSTDASHRPSLSRRSSQFAENSVAGSMHRSISNADLAQIRRTFSAKPRSRQNSHQDGVEPCTLLRVADTTSTAVSQPSSAAQQSAAQPPLHTRSRQGSHADIRSLIQHKRRQASGPYKSMASVADEACSPSARTPTAYTAGQGRAFPASKDDYEQTRSNFVDSERHTIEQPLSRRMRSRRSSAVVPGQLNVLTQAHLDTSSHNFEEARMRALRGMSEIVMTPSVEEWRQLGLTEDLNQSDGDSSSSSDDAADATFLDNRSPYDLRRSSSVSRPSNISSINQYYGSVPPDALTGEDARVGLRRSTSNGSKYSRGSRSQSPFGLADLPSESDTGEDEGSELSKQSPTTREMAPTLSRGSVAAGGARNSMSSVRSIGMVAGGSSTSSSKQRISPTTYTRTTMSSFSTESALNDSIALPFNDTGPIDPHRYSAVTGARNIFSFTVEEEAGKGAYGLVRKVREIGPDGQPRGPFLMLKYIVKQRILADAYKRHKVLGAIPMEIHVLDHIRRVYRRPPSDDGIDPVAAAQISRSTMTAASLLTANGNKAESPLTVGHPNLCGMLDFFEDAENYYLVMPCFGSGQDLFDYVDLAPTGLTVAESRSILLQIVDGVAFLHSHGIVHRDIKDENVILDGSGSVQLIDFGSAAYIKEGKPYFDTFSGTLDFASPEVLRGERYGGKETDIWALGVLAYVILCGECPFWSSDESLAGLAHDARPYAALLAKAETVQIAISDARDGFLNANAHVNDAVDFIRQCLQVHARDRPSALQLKQHCLLVGSSGWQGLRGWESDIVQQCN